MDDDMRRWEAASLWETSTGHRDTAHREREANSCKVVVVAASW